MINMLMLELLEALLQIPSEFPHQLWRMVECEQTETCAPSAPQTSGNDSTQNCTRIGLRHSIESHRAPSSSTTPGSPRLSNMSSSQKIKTSREIHKWWKWSIIENEEIFRVPFLPEIFLRRQELWEVAEE